MTSGGQEDSLDNLSEVSYPLSPVTTYQKIEHEFVFKLSWRATAKTVFIKAQTVEEAEKRLDREVRKMIGGEWLMDIKLVDVRRGDGN